MCHHAWLIFVFLVETRFHHAGQDGLDLLTCDTLTLAFQSAGITGVSHHAWPHAHTFCFFLFEKPLHYFIFTFFTCLCFLIVWKGCVCVCARACAHTRAHCYLYNYNLILLSTIYTQYFLESLLKAMMKLAYLYFFSSFLKLFFLVFTLNPLNIFYLSALTSIFLPLGIRDESISKPIYMPCQFITFTFCFIGTLFVLLLYFVSVEWHEFRNVCVSPLYLADSLGIKFGIRLSFCWAR